MPCGPETVRVYTPAANPEVAIRVTCWRRGWRITSRPMPSKTVSVVPSAGVWLRVRLTLPWAGLGERTKAAYPWASAMLSGWPEWCEVSGMWSPV